MKLLMIAMLAIALPALAWSNEQSQSVSVAQKAVREKGIWIDVRTPEEFKAGHLQGAINIPVDKIAQEIAKVSKNKNEPIHVYCRSGRRSEAALHILQDMGYSKVKNQGGYQELLNKGIR